MTFEKKIYIFICLAILSFTIFLIYKYSFEDNLLKDSNNRIIPLKGSWEYLSRDSGKDIQGRFDVFNSDNYLWKGFNERNFYRDVSKTHTKIVWLRYKLPRIQFKEPALYLEKYSYYQSFEVFLNNTRIYKYGKFLPKFENKFMSNKWHIFSITPNFQEKYIYIRLYSNDNRSMILKQGGIFIGNYRVLMLQSMKSNLELILFGFVLSILGAFAVLVYLMNHESKVLLYFSYMTISFGIYFILDSNISSLFFDIPAVKGIIELFFSYSSLISLFMLLNRMRSNEESNFIRHMWKFYLIFGIINFVLDLYLKQINELISITFLITVLFGVLTIFIISIKEIYKTNEEGKVLGVGTFFLSASLMHSILLNFGVKIFAEKAFLHWGLFIFIISLAYIMILRYENVRKQLKEYTADLEKMVSERAQKIIEKNVELEKAEKKYRNIFENAPVGIFQSVYNEGFINLNSEAARMMGYKNPDEMIKNIKDLSKDFFESVDNYDEFTSILLANKQVNNYETMFNKKDGSKAWFSMNVKLTEKDNQRVMEGFVIDINEKKKLETELVILSQAIEYSPYSFSITNTKGITKYINPSACKSFGISNKESFVGQEIMKLWNMSKDEAAFIFEKILPEKREWRQEFELKSGDKITWIGTYIYPVTNKKNEIINFIIIQEDITKRKEEEEVLKRAKIEAENANVAKSEFLANMSHEIRTPMNAVLGFTGLLSNLIKDEKQKKYLEAIDTSGKNLLMLINDILDLSKIEAGKMKIEVDAVNPFDIFNEMKNIFSLKVEEKGLEFIIDVDPDLPRALLLDEVRLRQILLNLIGNSVKFTHKGYIRLAAKKIYKGIDNSCIDLTIAVEDTGIGIKKESQKSIFEAFKQQDGQSTKKYGGTGLGLSITKRLAEMMGGAIALQSEEGKGSVFEIILQNIIVAASIAKEQASSFEYTDIEFEPATILSVDDVEHNRVLIREIFSNTNLRIIEAENGEEAFEISNLVLPDLILMDIRMPVMDGYDATKLIKENSSTSHIKIIALTASSMKGEEDKFAAAGFDGILKKPVHIEDLYRELSKHLKHKINERALHENDAIVNVIAIDSIENNTLSEEAIVQLEKTYLKKWSIVIKNNRMNDIEDFAKEIGEFGLNNKNEVLTKVGNDLLIFVENFDIENMEKLLKAFPEIVEEIKRKKRGENG